MTINETIYKKIIKIIPEILEPDFEYKKLQSSGFMDLHVDLLLRDGERIDIALAHNYRHPSGDTIPDPDMRVYLHREHQLASALSYQDAFGYREVSPEPGKIDLKAKRELNQFLNQWLSNIIDQGHC